MYNSPTGFTVQRKQSLFILHKVQHTPFLYASIEKYVLLAVVRDSALIVLQF